MLEHLLPALSEAGSNDAVRNGGRSMSIHRTALSRMAVSIVLCNTLDTQVPETAAAGELFQVIQNCHNIECAPAGTPHTLHSYSADCNELGDGKTTATVFAADAVEATSAEQ